MVIQKTNTGFISNMGHESTYMYYLDGKPYGISFVDKLLGSFFTIALALSPIDFFPSGKPQIADFLLLVWSMLVLLLNPQVFLLNTCKKFLQLAMLLVYYIALVSLLWGFVLSDIGAAYSLLYYVFNFLIILSLSVMISKNIIYWREVLQKAVFFTTLVSLIGFIYYFDTSSIRQTGGFNNPNQLGYFSLLTVCIAIVIFGERAIRSYRFWIIISVSSLLVLSSLSLTANVALFLAFLGLILLAKAGKRSIRLVIVLSIIATISIVLYNTTELGKHLETGINIRINTIDKKTEDTMGSRGYTRIVEFPHYTIFGAAEGARYRFGPAHHHEIHSSLGTLLFSYGVIGLTLFCIMIFSVLRYTPIWAWFIILAPLAYSTTHQGLRTTFFWVFLLLTVFYAQNFNKKLK